VATPGQQPKRRSRLARRFELLRKLGEGSYGIVYEALDLESYTRVALKTLQRMEPDALLRFKEEFRYLATVEHENLVHLGELMCNDDVWFFTMELVDGTDFHDYVRPPGASDTDERVLDVARLRASLLQLANALLAVHASGRVHCDVKPTNIRVDRAGRLVLLDFGLVTEVARKTADLWHTPVLGTPGYMAPEQCSGAPMSAAADWYAVGAVLYEALTGTLPFTGSALGVMADKQSELPIHPRERAPEAPADLADLCMMLLRVDPEDRPKGPLLLSLLAHGAPHGSGVFHKHTPLPEPDAEVFVGRAPELVRLRQHFERTCAGLPALAYITGESGVGKSSLARHFATELADSGALVLRSRCYERETVPYKAFDGVIDDLARHLQHLTLRECRKFMPGNARLLVQAFPVLTAVAPAMPPHTGPLAKDPNVLRSQTFAALREILARLAQERPVLLVVDDLQWTDLDSLSLLTDMLTSLEAPACMILATGRSTAQLPESVAAELAPLLARDLALELQLGGLDDADAQTLAHSLARKHHDGVLLATIAREARGHPLFVAELLRHVEAGRTFAQKRHLADALRDRVSALSQPTRALLEMLAVASTPTSHPILCLALNVDAPELRRQLSQLRSGHLVRSEDRLRSECYHDEVRRAVLTALSDAARSQRHRALAEALTQFDDSDAEQVAYHFRAAGDMARAVRYYAQAAEEADRALAFDRAARLYEEALSAPASLSPARVTAMRIARAQALSSAGLSGRAAEAYLEASHTQLGEKARMLRRRATQLMLRSGRFAEGLELADEALHEVGLARPGTPTRAVLRLAWERYRLATRGFDYATEGSQDERAGPTHEMLELLWAVAPSLAFVDVLGGSALQSLYARLALGSGDMQHVVRSLTMEAILHATMESPPQPGVTRLLQQVRDAASRTNVPYHRAMVYMAHGYAHWTNYRLSEALSPLTQAERLLRQACVDVAWELANARVGLLNALWNSGRLWQHEELATDWQRDARERGDRYAGTQLVVLGLSYQTYLRHDDPDTADDVLESCLAGWPEAFQLPHWSQFVGKQLVALYRGGDGAHALLRKTWPSLQRSRLLNIPYFALITHLDASLACIDHATCSRGSARRELLHEATRHTRELSKSRWAFAQLLADQTSAQAHLLVGRVDDAVTLLIKSEAAMREQDSIYQYPTGFLAGRLLAGDEGHALCQRALAWAEDEAIENPVQWFGMFVPALRALS
jgi:hypothetical protein